MNPEADALSTLVARSELLKLLIDEDVKAVSKARLGPEGIADLVLEIVNHHLPLSTAAKARLAGGVSPRTIRDRAKRGGAA